MTQATKRATPPPVASAPLSLYRFSVEQYQQLQREGTFGSDRVELLDGIIVRKGPMNPPHAVSLGRVQRQLEAHLPAGWCLRQQMDLTLTDSQPVPDVAIVLGSADDYATRHPVPAQVGLVVEVSDTTLDDDRTTKLRMYARDRIPVYWIVNIPERRLEVYSLPVGGKNPRYRDSRSLAAGEAVTVPIGAYPVGPVPVGDLLPPA